MAGITGTAWNGQRDQMAIRLFERQIQTLQNTANATALTSDQLAQATVIAQNAYALANAMMAVVVTNVPL